MLSPEYLLQKKKKERQKEYFMRRVKPDFAPKKDDNLELEIQLRREKEKEVRYIKDLKDFKRVKLESLVN